MPNPHSASRERIARPVSWLCTLFMLCISLSAGADELGLSVEVVYEKTLQEAGNTLFIDVRDPVEIMFVGFTDAVDANVPYLLVNRKEWDAEKKRLQVNKNPDFLAGIDAALKAKGLTKDAQIVTMCRSGSERGRPSADFLRKNGYPNAYYAINGFQGSSAKEGPQKGLRVVNGWQNSGLPWQPKPNPEKLWGL